MKHIPGPWYATTRVGREPWDWVVASAADPNIEICQMFHDGTDENERGEANAKLVAAAPDLLKAATAALASHAAGFMLSGDVVEALRRSIKAAES